jgi:hypothetical protein
LDEDRVEHPANCQSDLPQLLRLTLAVLALGVSFAAVAVYFSGIRQSLTRFVNLDRKLAREFGFFNPASRKGFASSFCYRIFAIAHLCLTNPDMPMERSPFSMRSPYSKLMLSYTETGREYTLWGFNRVKWY